jgi:hypothetical protein
MFLMACIATCYIISESDGIAADCLSTLLLRTAVDTFSFVHSYQLYICTLGQSVSCLFPMMSICFYEHMFYLTDHWEKNAYCYVKRIVATLAAIES